MALKCIALGNRLMGDDAIGIYVAEALEPLLKQEGIQVILGETDVYYALNQITEGDYLIIMDASCFNTSVGSVTKYSLKELPMTSNNSYSLHQPSLLSLIGSYYKLVNGIVIGIEADKIEFTLGLSEGLKSLFPSICQEVYRIIMESRRK